ncbi:hypothetical protein PFISCL1PPCAC_16 [Pristionchus fissidentatus]|uniref:Erg-28 n=1 Tax=Pristionchus fissidentatus TaxID=1538716 RepID=A0AAV5UNW3_9BILA|nr:hypothetical protein PFISCL1PPCAC_16 [Pristionchus fissidentatus]
MLRKYSSYSIPTVVPMVREEESGGDSKVLKYLKGWTAFNILQLLGPIFLAYCKPSTLATQTLPGGSDIHMRSQGHVAMMMLIVKVSLLLNFSCRPLHAVHLITSLASVVSLSLELGLYKALPANTTNLFSLGLAVINVVLWAVFWRSLSQPEEPVVRKGPRKLFAKHYMEGNAFGMEDIETEKSRRSKDKRI